MQESAFRDWLRADGKAESTVSTQLSKLRKIERHFGDLDDLAISGRLQEVANQLAVPDSLPESLGNLGERKHLKTSFNYFLKFVEVEQQGGRFARKGI